MDGGEAPSRSPASPSPNRETAASSSVAVYNYRGELQALPLAPSAMQAGRISRTSFSLSSSPTPPLMDSGPQPVRPPPSLTGSAKPSSSAPGRPRVRGCGTALVAPEPVNATSGKREVMIGPDMRLEVMPEERVRFVEVELSCSTPSIVRGTVLGTDGVALVWHERGKRYAQRLLPTDYKSLVLIIPARCKHCGAILPRDEADEHVASHKRGGGLEIGTAVGDDLLGTACGDTSLLLRLVKVKRLGSGAQGEVWLCRDAEAASCDAQLSQGNGRSSRGVYVQKDMQCGEEKEAIAKYQQSVRIMSMHHVHIISYLAVQRHPREPVVTVVMPYYLEGDLAGLIRHQQGNFEEHYLLSLLLQMAHALEFLHSRSPCIIHGDIKPENVLLFNSRQQVVLMDLDASLEMNIHQSHAEVKVGTSAWMAPEALHDMQESPKSDIWSLGLLAYVLCALPDFPILPCEATGSSEALNSKAWTMNELLRRVGGRVVSRGFSRDFAVLITKMMHHNPVRRPSAADLVENLTTIMTSLLVKS